MSNDLREFAELVNSKQIYVQVVVPDFATLDFEFGEYTGWYVGHHSLSQLDEHVISGLYDDWHATSNCDDIEAFMQWLGDSSRADWHGHIVFNSGYEGVCAIDTGFEEDEDEEEVND